MPRNILFMPTLLLATSLVGCWSPFHDLNSGQGLDPKGSAFVRALYGGYVGLSESRSWSFDLDDGEHFNLKAKAAAGGERVTPDRPESRRLGEVEAPLLADAYRRLWKSYQRGARRLIPAQAAEAQVRYDCWLEAAEGGRREDARRCSLSFEIAMAELQLAMLPASRVGRSTDAGRPLSIEF